MNPNILSILLMLFMTTILIGGLSYLFYSLDKKSKEYRKKRKAS